MININSAIENANKNAIKRGYFFINKKIYEEIRLTREQDRRCIIISVDYDSQDKAVISVRKGFHINFIAIDNIKELNRRRIKRIIGKLKKGLFS